MNVKVEGWVWEDGGGSQGSVRLGARMGPSYPSSSITPPPGLPTLGGRVCRSWLSCSSAITTYPLPHHHPLPPPHSSGQGRAGPGNTRRLYRGGGHRQGRPRGTPVTAGAVRRNRPGPGVLRPLVGACEPRGLPRHPVLHVPQDQVSTCNLSHKVLLAWVLLVMSCCS